MRHVVILGSTGSIGTQALEVIDSRRDQFDVVGLTAGGSQLDLLAAQVREFAPRLVAVPTEADAAALRALLPGTTTEIVGEGGNERAARMPAP